MLKVPFKTIGLAGVLLLAAAEAQSATTWRFDVPPPGTDPCAQSAVATTNTTTGVTTYPFGNNIFCTPVGGGAPTATATAWSNSAGTATTTAGNTTLENAYITVYQNSTGTSPSGIGITNRLVGTTSDPGEASSPEHAIDNNATGSTTSTYTDPDYGRYDMVLLDFSTKVNLTGLSIGWYSTDVDITVMAFDPTSAAQTSSLAGKKYTQLTSSGWSIVGHYANLTSTNTVYSLAGRSDASGTDAVISANTDIESRYWLIGAYNPTVGTVSGGVGLNAGNDYFKLLSVVGNPSSPPAPPGTVPEPAALALIFASAVGFGTFRARRRK